MPTAGTGGEYLALQNSYEPDATGFGGYDTAYAFSALRAGSMSYTSSGSLINSGTESGFFWSSTYYDSDTKNMRSLRTMYNGSWYFWETYHSRNTNMSVRCLVAH